MWWRGSKPEEAIHLHDERAGQEPWCRGPRLAVPFLVVNDEEFAAGAVLPAQARVRADAVRAGVVLHERADKEERRNGIGDARADQAAGKAARRQVDPVQRDARLDRQPG